MMGWLIAAGGLVFIGLGIYKEEWGPAAVGLMIVVLPVAAVIGWWREERRLARLKEREQLIADAAAYQEQQLEQSSDHKY